MMDWKNAELFAPFLRLRRKAYREYLRLLWRYRRVQRLQPQSLRCLDYRLEVPDVLSFIFQFKEIFVRESYRFETGSPQPVIYDCGANIGLASLYFRSLYPRARIRAFEPEPLLLTYLERNLIANSASDVEIIPKAVWIHKKGVNFLSDGADAGSIQEKKTGTRVPTIRLKDLLRQEHHIDFLKMDIEGAETEVLSDCGKDLRIIDRLFVEYHDSGTLDGRLEKVLKALSSNGFRYWVNPVSHIEQPFVSRRKEADFPLQLNIFAESRRSRHER